MYVYALSDLHVEHKRNREYLNQLLSACTQHQKEYDVLLVAGDVCNGIKKLEESLTKFVDKFRYVFYCPGNHELWSARDPNTTSNELFYDIIDLCDGLGVFTQPACVDGVWIVPLYSWYDRAFAQGTVRDDEYKDVDKLWSDARLCTWSEDPSPFFVKYTEEMLKEKKFEGEVITFSHFLPRLELLPPKSFLRTPFLPAVVGTDQLERWVRSLGSTLHVFGHSHISWDQTIDEVRYKTNPVAGHTEHPRWHRTWDGYKVR